MRHWQVRLGWLMGLVGLVQAASNATDTGDDGVVVPVVGGISVPTVVAALGMVYGVLRRRYNRHLAWQNLSSLPLHRDIFKALNLSIRYYRGWGEHEEGSRFRQLLDHVLHALMVVRGDEVIGSVRDGLGMGDFQQERPGCYAVLSQALVTSFRQHHHFLPASRCASWRHLECVNGRVLPSAVFCPRDHVTVGYRRQTRELAAATVHQFGWFKAEARRLGRPFDESLVLRRLPAPSQLRWQQRGDAYSLVERATLEHFEHLCGPEQCRVVIRLPEGVELAECPDGVLASSERCWLLPWIQAHTYALRFDCAEGTPETWKEYVFVSIRVELEAEVWDGQERSFASLLDQPLDLEDATLSVPSF